MSIADDIASRVKPGSDETEGAADDAAIKPGDLGKRIRAALKVNSNENDIAIEDAIRECMEGDY